MSIYKSLKLALFSLLNNKMRSFLTMLGIIIGIASVMIIVAIGNGSQAAMEKEFESFGTGTKAAPVVETKAETTVPATKAAPAAAKPKAKRAPCKKTVKK